MKKLISLLVLVAHATTLVAASDPMQLKVNANGDKFVTGADALQLQKDQWERDDQQLAKYKKMQKDENTAVLPNAILQGHAGTIAHALRGENAADFPTAINGIDASTEAVALDLLVKEAKTYKYPTMNAIMNASGTVGKFAIIEGILISAIGLAVAITAYAKPKLTSYFPLNQLAGVSTNIGGCLILGGTVLAAPSFIQWIKNYSSATYEAEPANYWNNLEKRFRTARILLNNKAANLSQFSTPQMQQAVEFIRTREDNVTTYKQFIADVHAGKYDCLLVQTATA